MKTEDLIAVLSTDTQPRPGVAARLTRALLPALAVSAVALVTLWRVRPDLAQALASLALMKTLMSLALALIALALARGLARPEGQARGPMVLLAMLVIGSGLAVGAALSQQGATVMLDLFLGPNALTCLVSVPVLSALPLAATLWAMRAGAPRNPAAAGAAAGLLATGAATAIYTLHCPVDTVLFLPVYATAMLAVVSAGALIGGRMLRW